MIIKTGYFIYTFFKFSKWPPSAVKTFSKRDMMFRITSCHIGTGIFLNSASIAIFNSSMVFGYSRKRDLLSIPKGSNHRDLSQSCMEAKPSRHWRDWGSGLKIMKPAKFLSIFFKNWLSIFIKLTRKRTKLFLCWCLRFW